MRKSVHNEILNVPALLGGLPARQTNRQTDRAMYTPVNHRVSCLFIDFHDFRYFAYTCGACGFLLPTCRLACTGRYYCMKKQAHL